MRQSRESVPRNPAGERSRSALAAHSWNKNHEVEANRVVRESSEPTPRLRYSAGTDDSNAAIENRIVMADIASTLSPYRSFGNVTVFHFVVPFRSCW